MKLRRDALKNFNKYFSILRNISAELSCTAYEGKKVWSKTEIAARSNIKKYAPPGHIFDAARWVSLTFREFFAGFFRNASPVTKYIVKKHFGETCFAVYGNFESFVNSSRYFYKIHFSFPIGSGRVNQITALKTVNAKKREYFAALCKYASVVTKYTV